LRVLAMNRVSKKSDGKFLRQIAAHDCEQIFAETGFNLWFTGGEEKSS
jgi:hypothetical protein